MMKIAKISTIVQIYKHETRHDKTNQMSVRPAKTQISLGILIRVIAVRMK